MTDWQNVPHPEPDEDFTGFAAWRDAFWADDPEGFREWLDEKQQQREEIRAALAKLTAANFRAEIRSLPPGRITPLGRWCSDATLGRAALKILTGMLPPTFEQTCCRTAEEHGHMCWHQAALILLAAGLTPLRKGRRSTDGFQPTLLDSLGDE